MKVLPWRLLAVFLSGMVMAAGVSYGVAQASIPAANGVISACYGQSGILHVIDASTQSCAKKEDAISWPSSTAGTVSGWQVIHCYVTDTDQNSNPTALAGDTSNCYLGTQTAAGTPVVLTCPPGKVVVDAGAGESNSDPGMDGNSTGMWVFRPDGSGVTFRNLTINGATIICVNGSA